MSSVDFDYPVDPIFRYLPSFWRDSYKDGDMLKSVYEAWLRCIDVDYATLAQVDNCKDLCTLPTFTEYPAIYQTFNNWESLGARHSHVQLFADWPTAVNGQYVIRFENRRINEQSQLYLDGIAIPSFLYTLSYDPWIDTTLKFGTTVTFDDTVLSNYITGTFQGSFAPSTFLGLGAFAGPSDISTLGVYSFRDIQIATFAGDGTTKDFTLGTGLDDFDTELIIRSVPITSLATVETTADGFTITPKPANGFGSGNILAVSLNDGTTQFFELTGTAQSISLTTTADVENLQLYIQFKLDPDLVQVNTDSVQLLGGQKFYGGARVRVTDPSGSQSFTLETPSSKIQLTSPVDPNQTEVRFLGVDLTRKQVSGGVASFTRPPQNGVEFAAFSPIDEDHVHQVYSETLATASNTITLPLTPGVLQVFLDDLLVRDDTYSVVGSVITLTETMVPGTRVDVYYTSSGTTQHRHVQTLTYIAPQAASTFTFAFDEPFSDTFPVQVFRDGYLDTENITTVNNQFVQFEDALNATNVGTVLIGNGAIESKAYKHDIEIRTDKVYNYDGQVASFSEIRDRLKTPTSQITDFELEYLPRESTTLFLDSTPEAAWLCDAQVNERLTEKVWGQNLGLIQDTSARYNALVASLATARYSASTVESIENFGSLLLGSPFTTEESTSLGVTGAGTRIFQGRPTNPRLSDFTVTIDNTIPLRVKDAPEIIPKFWALNDIVRVKDGADLQEVPWLVYFAEELSSDYGFAKRIDVEEPNDVGGNAAAYDRDTGILYDPTTNFFQEEVQVGDLVCLNISSVNSTGTTAQTAYLYDQEGFVAATSYEYNVPDATYPNGFIDVTLTFLPTVDTPIQVQGDDGSIWEVSVGTVSGILTTTNIGVGTVAPVYLNGQDGSVWELTVDAPAGNLVTTISTEPSPVDTVVIPGLDNSQWELYTTAAGILVTEQVVPAVYVPGTDGSQWSLTADINGALVTTFVGAGPYTTPLLVNATDGATWNIEVDPSGIITTTLADATPVIPAADIDVVGTGSVYWEVQATSAGVLFTTESSVLNNFESDRFEVGDFIGLIGTGYDQPTIFDGYEVLEVTESTTEIVLRVPWIRDTAPDDTLLTGGLSVYGLDIQSLVTVSDPSTTVVYTTVDEVVDEHRIVTPQLAELNVEAVGFGENGYGEGLYGGNLLADNVSSYTVFSRRTRGVDSNLYLNQALPDASALAKGESIEMINSQLATILGNHAFVMEYDWRADREEGTIEDLASAVDDIRPAETRAFIFTEAYRDEGGISDAPVTTTLIDNDSVELSTENEPIVGSFAVGLEPLTVAAPVANLPSFTTTENTLAGGPQLETQAASPLELPETVVECGYYLTGSNSVVNPTSVWGRTYTETVGLQNLVLKASNTDGTTLWTADSGFGARVGNAIDLEARSLRIPSTGQTNFQTGLTPNTLSYSEGDPFSVEMWVKVSAENYTLGQTGVIFSWGDLVVGVELDSEGLLQPFIQNAAPAVAETSTITGTYELPIPSGNDDVVADPDEDPDSGDPDSISEPLPDDTVTVNGNLAEDAFLHLVVTYAQNGLQGDHKLYVNSSEVATLLSSELLGDFNSDAFIGALSSNVATSDIILDRFVLYDVELSAADVATAYATTEVVIGVTDNAIVTTPANSKIVYNFFNDNNTIIDYSGNGFVAQKQGAGTSTNWLVPGFMKDTLPRVGDTHAIKSTGFLLFQGALLSQTEILAIAVDNPTDASAIEAGETATVLNGVSFALPSIWLSYDDQAGWQQIFASVPRAGTPVGVDTSTL